MKMTVECTAHFAKLLGVAAAKRFVEWALRDNAKYQDAHEGEEHGQLTYRYPPGYWGTLGGVGQECAGLNFAFPAPARQTLMRYYSTNVPPS